MNICSVCKKQHDGPVKTCEKCREYNRQWRANNKERERAKAREWYRRNRERVIARKTELRRANPERTRTRLRKNKLKARYGLSLEDYNRLALSQNNACAICQESPGVDVNLDVDHCHLSGKVRGLLCRQCNTAIGSLKHNPELTRAATEYLEKER